MKEARASEVQIVGSDYSNIAAHRDDLGKALRAEHNFKAAIEVYRAALQREAELELLPKRYYDLGAALRQDGDLEAAAYLRKAVACSKPLVVAASLNELGLTLREQKDYKGAAEQFERGVEVARELLGDDHPAVGTYRSNLGQTLPLLGDFTKSGEHLLAALENAVRTCGPFHPLVSTRRMHLAQSYLIRGKYLDAQSQFELELTHARWIGSPSLVAKVTFNLGVVARRSGRVETAIELLRSALELGVGWFDASAFANVRAELGAALRDHGDFQGAVDVLSAALLIVQSPEDASALATLRLHLGHALQDQGHLDQALECFQLALTSDLATYGPGHTRVAGDQSAMGALLCKSPNLGNEVGRNDGNLERGVELIKTALESDLRSLGPDHPSVATHRRHMARALQQKGDYPAAISYFRAALDSDRNCLHDEHPRVVNGRQELKFAILAWYQSSPV